MAGLIAFGDGGCSLTILLRDLRGVRREVRPAARRDLVHDHAHREDVGLRRHRLVRDLLRRHVADGVRIVSLLRKRRSLPFAARQKRQRVEAGQLHLPIRGDEHRVAGDVEMQHVLRLHQLHGVGELIDDAKEFGPIGRASAICRGDRSAVEPLHDHHQRVVGRQISRMVTIEE